jgi:2'-5' RNA ligase
MSENYSSQQKELVKQLEAFFAGNTNKSMVAEVVEVQDDYVKNKRICLTSVVFPPAEITAKITTEIIDKLRAINPEQYFLPPESIHLTIKNIRTISDPPSFTAEDIVKVNKLFSELIPQYPSFEFKVEDVVLFPTSVSVMAYSDDSLQKLVLALDQGLKEIGLPDDKKYFSDSVFWGNITLCRFTKTPSEKFIAEVKKMRDLKIGKFQLEKVNLITGNAACYAGLRKIHGEYELKR